MSSIRPDYAAYLTQCGTCHQECFPDLLAVKKCHHVFCRACVSSWLRGKQKASCPNCQRTITSIGKSFRTLRTYLHVFAHHFLLNSGSMQKEMDSLERGGAHQCTVDLEDYTPVVFSADQKRFYHQNCQQKNPDKAVAAGPFYPEDIARLCSRYGLPPYLETERQQYLVEKAARKQRRRVLYAFLGIVPFIAYVWNGHTFHHRNPLLFTLGLPVFIVVKTASFGLKLLRSLVEAR